MLFRRVYGERGALLAVGESLVREIARLRQDIEDHKATVNEMHELRVECEATKALEVNKFGFCFNLIINCN